MTKTRVRGMGLSTRITLLSFAAVTIACAFLSAIALSGVDRSVRNEEMARLDAFRTLVSVKLDAEFAGAEHTMDTLASRIAHSSSDLRKIRSTLAEALETDSDTFDSIVAIDRTGSSVAAAGGELAAVPGQVYGPAEPYASGKPTLAWESGASGASGRLWVACAVGETTPTIVIYGRLRSNFLDRTLEDVAQAKGSFTAVVLDRDGALVLAGPGDPLIDLDSIELLRDGPNASGGTAAASSVEKGSWSGSWERMSPDHGLGWQVAVFEADSVAFGRAADALLPAGFSILLVVAAVVIGSLIFSHRLLAPLTVLEQRARDVAAGGYIKPLRVVRDDEMGRLAEAFNEMGVRLNSLHDMAHLLASASSLDDVLDAVLSAIGRIFGTGEAAILLVDPPGLALSLVAGRGLATPAVTLLVPLDEISPFSQSFIEERVVLFSGDEEGDGGTERRIFGAEGARAGVVVPLAIGHEVIGVIVVLTPGRRAFTPAQIDTLRGFSANAAVAVRTSRLFAEERLSRTEAEALRTVTELTVRPGDLTRALEDSSATAAGLLGYRGWTVVLENRHQLGLGTPHDKESDRLLVEAWRLVEEGRGDTASAAHAPIFIDDVRRRASMVTLVGPEWGSALFIPIVQGSIARGALVLFDRTRKNAPSERERLVASAIGQQVSLALRNAYLLQQARTRTANLETVFRISQTVSSELQLSAVLNRVLDVVQKILSADAVALMSYDAERHMIETSMARGIVSNEMLHFSARPGEDIPGRVIALGVPVSYGDLSNRPTSLAGMAAHEGFESVLAVPLMARGRPIGVLTVYSKATAAFSGEDVELMLTFAAQAALAVDTASLYGKEHHVASVLQASILPERLPVVPGLELASWYLPSGAEAEIGGDYYDVFAADDGRMVLAIGDVCGKGVEAATKTSMVKYTLRGLIGAGAGPGRALAELNRQVSVSGDPADIVTMWVGVLDVETGMLTFADGGHPPALLNRADGSPIERLEASGPLLGAVASAIYEERTVELGFGDLILLYTDGVTEARREGRFFGEGRVCRVLRSSRSAGECVDQLLEKLKEFSAGPLRDDAAALAFRRVEPQTPLGRVTQGQDG